jgi:hypothetical protein
MVATSLQVSRTELKGVGQELLLIRFIEQSCEEVDRGYFSFSSYKELRGGDQKLFHLKS